MVYTRRITVGTEKDEDETKRRIHMEAMRCDAHHHSFDLFQSIALLLSPRPHLSLSPLSSP